MHTATKLPAEATSQTIVTKSATFVGSMINHHLTYAHIRVQELCGSRGGRPGLPVLMSLTVSADVKQH